MNQLGICRDESMLGICRDESMSGICKDESMLGICRHQYKWKISPKPFNVRHRQNTDLTTERNKIENNPFKKY